MRKRGRFHTSPLLRGALLVGALAVLGVALFVGIWSGAKKPVAKHATRPTANVLTGSVNLNGKTWHCRGPVDLQLVRVVMGGKNGDAVHLDRGCTGIIHRLEIVGDGGTLGPHGDGVKIHTGAHDLEILGGAIDCGARSPGKHQDAIQAMGGARVVFHGISSKWCRNSFMFINRGNHKRGLPTGIVCDSCRAETRNYSVFIGHSTDSGARESTFVSRVRPKILPQAVRPVESQNTWTAVAAAAGTGS
jgi:hypothetical protein